MVVFTCGHCGESVQKPKVEKHYLTKCRNKNPNLSCMDCFKDFLGNDYETHIKCVTEEERYSGKGFIAKEKKGEKKQNTWVEMLQSVLDEQKNAPKNVVRIIETISKHNNVPRKKPKFVNFVKNVCGHKTNPNDVDQAWDFISVKLSALSNVTQSKNQNHKNDSVINCNNEAGNNEKNNDISENNSESCTTQVNEETEVQNGETDKQNEESEVQNGDEPVDEKKLSKKQRKEEKKRKKYEAALQSAAESTPPVEAEEETENKKGKKKKNRTESTNGASENMDDQKQMKRKRQDTVNSVNGAQEPVENGEANIENEVNKEKTKKKKKVVGEDAEESICLHDQNVAKIEEMTMNSDKFNWHAVILSVLEKKGNEVPFKRLQKKVLSEYSESTGREVDDRIADKFIKKLKSAPNVRVDKNRVVLVQ